MTKSILSTIQTQHISLLSMAIYGLLQLIVVLLFWFCHLRHNQSHPIYRIRHPMFWIMCMAFGSFQISWKAIITYLRLTRFVSQDSYQVLNQFGVLLLGFSSVLARGFVLWFAIQFQQHQENQLFGQVLVSDDELVSDDDEFQQRKLHKNTKQLQQFLYRYERQLSNPFRVFIYLECAYIVLLVIGGLLTFFVSRTVSKYYIISIVVFFMLILGMIIYTIWSNGYKIKYNTNGKEVEMSTRFTDRFNFRWEITLLWIEVFIFVPLRCWLSIQFKVEQNAERAHEGLVVMAFLELLTQIYGVLIMIIVPFYTYSRRKSFRSVFRKSSTDANVFDVLSDKHGFFLFVNHAVQELNLENLSCFIAIYQFKHLKTSRDQLLKPVTKSNVERNAEPKDVELGLLSNTTPMVRMYCLKLIALPWKYLPLTTCLSHIMDSKYVQAQKVYDQFLSNGSLYSVNISGAARDYIDDKFIMLHKRAQKDKMTEKEEEFQNDLLKVFDMALPDLVNNLTDMMHRFRQTKEFQTLSI